MLKPLLPLLILASVSLAAAPIDPALLEKANAGDAEAQYKVGSKLVWQKNYDKNEVIKWWTLSADAGYWQAQLKLGTHYSDEKNHELAKKYMLMAASQGSVDAMNNLGYVESGGTGFSGSKVEALKWYRIGEVVSAQKNANVDPLKKEMATGEIERAEAEATKWLKEHQGISKK